MGLASSQANRTCCERHFLEESRAFLCRHSWLKRSLAVTPLVRFRRTDFTRQRVRPPMARALADLDYPALSLDKPNATKGHPSQQRLARVARKAGVGTGTLTEYLCRLLPGLTNLAEVLYTCALGFSHSASCSPVRLDSQVQRIVGCPQLQQ